MPKINAAGLSLLESFEGEVLFAYDDAVYPPVPYDISAGLRGTLTIGYGHTGPDVHPGQRITNQESATLLAADLHGFEVAVNNMVSHNINSNQFSALVCLCYNIGSSALHGSTLMRLLNAGDVMGAADQFAVWNKVDGVAVEGLTRRRAAERALFLGET